MDLRSALMHGCDACQPCAGMSEPIALLSLKQRNTTKDITTVTIKQAKNGDKFAYFIHVGSCFYGAFQPTLGKPFMNFDFSSATR